MSTTRHFESHTLLYTAIPQLPEIYLRNQNGELPLRLIYAPSADKGFLPLPTLHDTSYCRICFNPIQVTCTSIARVTVITSRRKRSSVANAAAASAARRNRVVQLESTNMCTYWPANPAFDPKRFLLRRLFFINEDRTKYVSVGFYPTDDYLPQAVQLVVSTIESICGFPPASVLDAASLCFSLKPCKTLVQVSASLADGPSLSLQVSTRYPEWLEINYTNGLTTSGPGTVLPTSDVESPASVLQMY